jgi:hypothetical protein
MANLVHWEWSVGPFVRTYLAAALEDERNLRLTLPSDPSRPMRAVVSYRIVQFARNAPAPIKVDHLHLQQVSIAAFEHLLRVYCGADLDSTLLIEPAHLRFRDDAGVSFGISVVLVWDAGVFGAFSGVEIDLGEEFLVDRVLFKNELHHHGEELEE